MEYRLPKGTKDIFGKEILLWQHVEGVMRDVCSTFGYGEVRTPVFEHTELFLRGIGDTTDVVQKEMYTFLDKGNRSITLKPEGTAGTVRAYMNSGLMAEAQPIKLYYITPAFRYEKPQAGRFREFHQFGIEAFGSKSAEIDAEVISLAYTLLSKLGIDNVELKINSVGCPECRADYNEKLKEYFEARKDKLCKTCLERLDKNPMRIIDCKVESCKEITKDAPRILDHLDEECSTHFEKLKSVLDIMGIDYSIDKDIVRGLDYYTKTVFEFISNDIGAQATVCGGGRYDNLIENIDGPATPGVGFGLGIERLLMTLEGNGIEIPMPETYDVFFVALGDDARVKAVELLQKMRKAGLKGDLDHLGRSMKAQFKYSDKMNAKYNIIIGEQELEKGIAMLRDMASGEQIEVQLDQLVDDVLGKLAK